MNATCSAGIPQPQRVSDLGRLLNSEITAPLVSNTSMAPAHLQGAFSNICMAPVHLQGALTSPCARQFIIPTRGSVCPPTSKVAISSLSGVSKETWLSLISPLEMAQRRRSFPSTFITKFSYLLFHPNRLTVAAFQRIHHIRFRERCLAVRADPTDMQIDARCTSTSSARFNTTTSCTAVVSGASDAGLPAPRLTCNAMSTGAPIPRSIDGNIALCLCF